MTITKPIEKSKLVEATRQYLSENVGNFAAISKGSGVSVEWLYKLNSSSLIRRASIKNPSALYCERVLKYAGFTIEVNPPKED
jgi:hypothetical protein